MISLDCTPHDLDLERRRAALLAKVGSKPLEHLKSPGHWPGQLYDCPACEATCYCGTQDGTECVYCAINNSQVTYVQMIRDVWS